MTEEEAKEFKKIIYPLLRELMKVSQQLVKNPAAMTQYALKTMDIDYKAYGFPIEFWDHIMLKLFKLYYRVFQGDEVTRGDVHKLIMREATKLVTKSAKVKHDRT